MASKKKKANSKKSFYIEYGGSLAKDSKGEIYRFSTQSAAEHIAVVLFGKNGDFDIINHKEFENFKDSA